MKPPNTDLFKKAGPEEDPPCCVCGKLNPGFISRDLKTNVRTGYCGLHVPEDWHLEKSLAKMLLDAFTDTSTAGGEGPAVEKNPFA